MSLKSLVNKSVIKSDMRRYWYVGVTFALALFVVTVLPLRSTLLYRPDTGRDFLHSTFYLMTQTTSLLIIVPFCIITPALLFSYLHHKSSVCETHRLPLRRECLYFSHLVSAAVLIALPIILNAAIMFTMVETLPSYILLWAALSMIYAFETASFSAAASMLVGNTAAGVMLPSIVMFLPLFFTGVMRILGAGYLYGYVVSGEPSFLRWIYPSYASLLEGKMYVSLALGIVFIALGAWFYQMRRLENHTRILAFDALNPVFMYGLAFCAGLTGYMYLSVIFYDRIISMWIGLPFGIIGIIVARMIISKSFKPTKILKPIIIYTAMMCVLYLFYGADITGFEKRVPDIENIASVNVTGDYGVTKAYTNPSGETMYLAESAQNDPTLYDKEDIEKVIALHRAMAENGGEKSDGYHFLPITYTLKDGSVMRRNYGIPDNNEEVFNLYCAVQELKQVKCERFPIVGDSDTEYTNVSVLNLGASAWLDPSRQEQILAALKQDVLNAKFTDTYNPGSSITSLSVDSRMPSLDSDKKPIEDKTRWYSETLSYNVYPSYTNCVALLTEWGLYDVMPSADQIEEIMVNQYTDKEYKFTYLRDKADIEKALAHIRDNRIKNYDRMGGNYQRFEIHYNSGTGYSDCTIDAACMEGITFE